MTAHMAERKDVPWVEGQKNTQFTDLSIALNATLNICNVLADVELNWINVHTKL